MRGDRCAALLAVACLMACGKKGPPLPPLVKLPLAPVDLNAARQGDTVALQFTVPSVNTDNTRPANVERVDVYAATGAEKLTDREFLARGARVGSVAVKAPRNPDDTVEPGEPVEDIEPLEGLGLDQGVVARLAERLTPAALARASGDASADRKSPRTAPPLAEQEGPLLGVWMEPLPSRTYVAVGINKRGRKGPVSGRVTVTLLPPPAAPATPTLTYTEAEVIVAWPPLARDRSAADDEVLPSRPVGEPAPVVAYNVYGVTPASGSTPSAETLLTKAAVAAAPFKDPRITWNETRCYAVRAVESFNGLKVESDEQAPACVTLTDTFGPGVPRGLTAVASEGAISLIWEANEEKDLDGYLVLRGGGAAGADLAPLTPSPIHETNFRDAVQAGTRFTYAVQAVDKAGNHSANSSPVEETAR